MRKETHDRAQDLWKRRRHTKDQCHDNAARRQNALQADSSPVWPKQDFQKQTLLRTLFARLDNEVSAWKAKTEMQSAAQKANKNGAAQARRERRLQVFAD